MSLTVRGTLALRAGFVRYAGGGPGRSGPAVQSLTTTDVQATPTPTRLTKAVPSPPITVPAMANPRGRRRRPNKLSSKPIGLTAPHVKTPRIENINPAIAIPLVRGG